MAEARVDHDWGQTANLMALIANCHRDPKKSRPIEASQFYPRLKRQKAATQKAPISILKDVFVKPKRPHVQTSKRPNKRKQ